MNVLCLPAACMDLKEQHYACTQMPCRYVCLHVHMLIASYHVHVTACGSITSAPMVLPMYNIVLFSVGTRTHGLPHLVKYERLN